MQVYMCVFRHYYNLNDLLNMLSDLTQSSHRKCTHSRSIHPFDTDVHSELVEGCAPGHAL